ncbi:SSI family serine proteinase inhibitor [Streptomyces pinistramenti]|uniref:SSI family serine proteinase inhibitor n=1 Tax=Streptomyces pinistramenti TaxID=2884812 RepID=UPI001D080699|nr:SSI family serine proteinase inhibitor [Streptomyces pinistramenti]MCB5910804.1 subtilase-type protease inhibitor [Streptomyces pinistramenti]
MPHRPMSLLTAAATAAVSALAVLAPAASAAPIPLPVSGPRNATGPNPTGPADATDTTGVLDRTGHRRLWGTPGLQGPTDHLTVTVSGSGSERTDGTFELYCHPDGGNHFQAADACDRLDRMTRWGKDAFAPVPQNAKCTMMYGGAATARITGTWAGRPVNADFRRTDGCEIARWDRFEPLLPKTGS